MKLQTSLTRDQMVAAITSGGCVQVGGVFYRRVEELPTEADLAVQSDNAELIALAEAKLLRDKEEIEAKLAKVRNAKSAKQSVAPVAAEPADDKDKPSDPPKALSQPPAKGK